MKRWPLHNAYFWETAPFFRLLLPLAAGIVIYDCWWFNNSTGYAPLALLLFFWVLFTVIISARKNNMLTSVLSTVALNGTLLFSGITISHLCDIRNDTQWFGNSSKSTSLARITEDPAEKEKTWKLQLSIVNTFPDGNARPAKGSAFLYLYKDGYPMLLHKGDSILIPGKWEPVKNAGNPHEFDYATYCHRNNLFYQQFCSGKDIRLYSAGDPAHTPFMERTHQWCMSALDKYLPDKKTKGLIQAMLLGDEVNLDEDLRRSYAETGIIHVIAISGGNIAIFFLVISFLLRWLRNNRYLWVKYALALPLVWLYVVMAGSSPSAVRAAAMFSLLAFGIMFEKNNNSLNQLFATAFILLCAQPMWLFSVGFQLSFVAVLSLILFYRPVYKWLSPPNLVARALWATVAASIAAEILVAPLVIYYFHIFPLLFIVANAAAYLFMGLVLVLGIAVLALSFLPLLAQMVGSFTALLVSFFDRLIVWLQQWNPPSFHYLMITGLELVAIWLAVAGLATFLLKKKKTALFAGLSAVIVLLMLLNADEWAALQQKSLVEYNIAGLNRIELIKGKYYNPLTPDTGDLKKINYATDGNHISRHAWKKGRDYGGLFIVNGKTVLILNRNIYSHAKFHIDVLILNLRDLPDLVQLQSIFTPQVIVIGCNISRQQQRQLPRNRPITGSNIHSVAVNGAFVLN